MSGGGAPSIPTFAKPVGWANGKDIACRDLDIGLFYPVEHIGDKAAKKIAAAKAICRTCKFHRECLDTAIANGEDGIWGGTTREERKKLRAQRNAS